MAKGGKGSSKDKSGNRDNNGGGKGTGNNGGSRSSNNGNSQRPSGNQGSPYRDGVTYKLNDQGTGIARQVSGGQGSSQKGSGVGQALRSAGANGNLSKKELLKISKDSGKSTDRIIQRLDKVNAKGADKGRAPIGLGSAAYNSLLKVPTSRTIYGKTMSELGLKDRYANYGSGPIGKAIIQGKGSSDYYGNTVPGTGKIPKGQQVFGSYNNAPQVQIKPKNNVNSGYYGPGSGNGNPTPNVDPVTDPVTDPITDPITEPTPDPSPTPDPLGAMGGSNSSVDGSATSIRRKKSSARDSGLTSRGTGQFRNSLKVGSASGINLGM
jgi:hypothetical protein